MTDTEYSVLYSQGTREHEQVILRLAGFTPDEEGLFKLIRHSYNPSSTYIEDTLHIDSKTRRALEHGMRLKVGYLILDAIREYGANHTTA